MNSVPLVVIAGPTGAGKTEIAIKLAKKRGEIVNADSRQLYKYLDIGTNKPTPSQQSQVPHHLFGIIEPDVQFSAGEYQKLASNKILDIYNRNKLPFLVGGTGLYIKSVIDGIFDGPSADKNIREMLKKKSVELGKEYLYNELLNIDPDYAKKIHPNDLLRVIRALEVYYITKIPLSLFFKNQKKNSIYNYLYIGIKRDRAELYSIINQRVNDMIKSGFIDEVKTIKEKGYSNIKAIGYNYIIDYLEGRIDLQKAIELISRDTRHYAKRQFTWFHSDKRIDWYDAKEYDKIEKKLSEWLKENRI